MSDVAIASSIIGGCGLLITLAYNKKSTKLAKHRMQKELFTEFNKRYDELNEYLVSISEYDNLNMLYRNKTLKNKLNDYFNLCAEEYYWWKKKVISKKVWNAWDKGMNDWYNNSIVIKQAWEQECINEGYLSYYITKKDEFFKLR